MHLSGKNKEKYVMQNTDLEISIFPVFQRKESLKRPETIEFTSRARTRCVPRDQEQGWHSQK